MPSPRLLVIEGTSPQTLADHIAVGGTAAHQGYSNLLRELIPGAIVDTCHPGDPTATLPDVATDKPPPAENAPSGPPNNATWLRVGLPSLPVRSPKDAKAAHAKAHGAKASGDKTTGETTTGAKRGEKSNTAKVASARMPEKDAGKDDDDEKPVRQFRAPVLTHATPAQPRLDPGRKEVFPPYLGAFGWQSK